MVETFKKAMKKLYHLFPKSPNPPGKGAIQTVETLKKAIATAEDGLRKVGEAEYAERLGLLRREYAVAELRLVVFGEFSRGKSTLINALLGRVVLPARAMPTTGHVTRVAWGEDDQVHVRLLAGKMEVCTLSQIDSFATLDFHRQARANVEAINVLVNCSLLKNGVVLYDTPGVCDSGAQTERALVAIASADLVVLVLNATQMLTQNEHELAVEWMRDTLGKAVVPVLNWMNIVEARDRAEIRRRIDRWSSEHFGSELGRPWFEVDARMALAHVIDGGPAPCDDFFALRQAITELTDERRRALQISSRRGQLCFEVKAARRGNGGVLNRIQQDAEQEERKREEIRRILRQSLQRFDANSRLKCDAVMIRATAVLASKLDRLISHWFQGEGKESLDTRAAAWYQDMLLEGIAEIEKEANGVLLALTANSQHRPDVLTIRENLILQSRLNVGELKPTGISDNAVAVAAWASGAVGQAIIPIPVVGFLAGMLAGGWLAEKLGQKPPDYVAAYTAEAREKWKDSTAEVMRLLQEQFDARVVALKSQITQRLKQADSAAMGSNTLANELEWRKAVDAALARCEELLQKQ